MTDNYGAFLASKLMIDAPTGMASIPELNPAMFGFQRDITAWALRRGRAAIWADCGLGKSLMAIEWSRCVVAHTALPTLILTPLAVAGQFVSEGAKFGVAVNHARAACDVQPGINVVNYERLHLLDPRVFGGVVLDESSILKDYTSATRNQLTEAFAQTPFRLACTATPAPNDHMELGNHAEFLGTMSRTEMLSMFFCHDGGETQVWRLKGHAQADFWRWVCSWAVSIRKPSDLGYPDEGYSLPALNVHEHVIDDGSAALARGAGMLFGYEANTLGEQRQARRESMAGRVARCAELVNKSADPWLVWCDLNAEQDALSAAIPDAVSVAGSDSQEDKEERLAAFGSGKARVLVSKPAIAGWGLNFQHCADVAFVGLSHSFEAWYQAVRRSYRFGQRRPVNAHVITGAAEGRVVASLKRKQAEAEAMASGMIANMSDITRAELGASRRKRDGYAPTVPMTLPQWLRTESIR